jgi:hypothetical protein
MDRVPSGRPIDFTPRGTDGTFSVHQSRVTNHKSLSPVNSTPFSSSSYARGWRTLWGLIFQRVREPAPPHRESRSLTAIPKNRAGFGMTASKKTKERTRWRQEDAGDEGFFVDRELSELKLRPPKQGAEVAGGEVLERLEAADEFGAG